MNVNLVQIDAAVVLILRTVQPAISIIDGEIHVSMTALAVIAYATGLTAAQRNAMVNTISPTIMAHVVMNVYAALHIAALVMFQLNASRVVGDTGVVFVNIAVMVAITHVANLLGVVKIAQRDTFLLKRMMVTNANHARLIVNSVIIIQFVASVKNIIM